MKYSQRELKTFNIFALLLFGIGGIFLIYGIIEFIFQPTTSYTIVREYRKAIVVERPATDDAELATEDAEFATEDAELATEDAELASDVLELEPLSEVEPTRTTQETMVVEGTNFRAVSNALIGAVFLLLSFALNVVLLRVMRHDGHDRAMKLQKKRP